MHKQTIQFAVTKNKNEIQRIGRGSILQPKTNYNGKGTKWFDDEKLIKRKHK